MNVAILLKQYFNNLADVSIDVFDAEGEVLRVLVADDGKKRQKCMKLA